MQRDLWPTVESPHLLGPTVRATEGSRLQRGQCRQESALLVDEPEHVGDVAKCQLVVESFLFLGGVLGLLPVPGERPGGGVLVQVFQLAAAARGRSPATVRSAPCIIGYGSSPSRCGPAQYCGGQTRDLPVRAQGACTRARICDHAGSAQALAMTRSAILPSALSTASAPGSETLAAQWLACVFLPTLRRPPHGCLRTARGQMWFAIPSLQRTCTCRLLAGLSAHRQLF